MDSAKIGLLTTLLLGVFILIGALLAFLIKKKEKVIDFSIGLALGVLLMLSILDLLPEIIEHLGLRYIYIFIIFTIIGYGILRLLDKLIPDHEDKKTTQKKMKNNLIHIGIVTSLAFILHNIIEAIAIYSTVITNTNAGLALALGIGFHNIPMGMVIASTFHQSNQNIWKTALIIGCVSLSTFLGGLIMFFLNLTSVSSLVLGTLLSITLGMITYIIISELYPRVKETKNKKISYIGIAIGVAILLISTLIH